MRDPLRQPQCPGDNHHPTPHRGFLDTDHPPPRVGVKLVRPRLRLRALQPDTLPRDGDQSAHYEQAHNNQPEPPATIHITGGQDPTRP